MIDPHDEAGGASPRANVGVLTQATGGSRGGSRHPPRQEEHAPGLWRGLESSRARERAGGSLPSGVSTWLAEHESVTIDPPAGMWRCRQAPTAPDALRFRHQLGLPTDRPVVMSGHQAAIWHAGIAAKVLASSAACVRFRATLAWVVVDQDVGVPGRVSYPLLRAGQAGAQPRLARGTLDLLPPVSAGVVTGMQPGGRCRPLELEKGIDPAVALAIGTMAAALDRRAGTESRAFQVTRAALDLLDPLLQNAGEEPGVASERSAPSTSTPALISALALARTDLFAWMLDQMRRDPAACAAHYNAAVGRHPDARLRPLRLAGPEGAELPLWRITPAGLREPVYASDLTLAPGSPAQLAPKALVMTALLRWRGCDLFIHGLGGGIYDPVMEDWLGAWLGVRDLAPAVVASATRLMALADQPPPTPEAVARARWEAHHARHNPGEGEATVSEANARTDLNKQAMARAIHRAEPTDRPRLFRAMHDWLAEQRRQIGPRLAALDARATELAAHADLSAIVFDRTWPFPLLPRDSMLSLRTEIERAIGKFA